MKSDFWDLILELFYDEDKEGFTLNYLDNYIYNLNNTEIKPYYFLFVVSGALIFAAKMLFSAIASIYGGLFGNIEVNGDYVVQNSYVPLIGIVILIAFSLHPIVKLSSKTSPSLPFWLTSIASKILILVSRCLNQVPG